MNAKQMFPSKYIKAEDLQGRATTVQIANVEIEEIGKTKDRRPVVYFRGKEKGMVLNKTNTNKICEILKSDDTDEWFGGVVVLYPTEVEFQGASTLAIRVKAPNPGIAGLAEKPKPVQEPPQQDVLVPSDDDIPF